MLRYFVLCGPALNLESLNSLRCLGWGFSQTVTWFHPQKSALIHSHFLSLVEIGLVTGILERGGHEISVHRVIIREVSGLQWIDLG